MATACWGCSSGVKRFLTNSEEPGRSLCCWRVSEENGAAQRVTSILRSSSEVCGARRGNGLLLAGNMDEGSLSDFVCESVSEGEENVSLSSIYQDHQISSSTIPVPLKNFNSSEVSPHSSFLTGRDSSSLGSFRALLSPYKRLPNLISDTSRHQAAAESHHKTTATINGPKQLLDRDSDHSVSPLHSHSDCSNDGYESGEAERSVFRNYMCEECCRLYQNAQRAGHAEEQTPKKPDPSHWCSKFWMLIPLPKENTGMKKKQNRSLNNVERPQRRITRLHSFPGRHVNNLAEIIRRRKPTAKPSLRCSRLHSFLKRNLRLRTKKKRLLSVKKGRLKRKKKTPAPTSQSKKLRQSEPSTSKNSSRNYTFVRFPPNSSEEEETTLDNKRNVAWNGVGELESLQIPSHESTAHNSSEDLASDLDEYIPSSRLHPPDHCSSDEGTSSRFAHVQSGSFRELLEKLNAGYLRSSIVNENRI